MTKYPGLCIGGPLDGLLHVEDRPVFDVSYRDEVSTVITSHRYIYYPVESIQLWLHHSETFASALTKMAVAYINDRTP